jgi:hypothetical protein
LYKKELRLGILVVLSTLFVISLFANTSYAITNGQPDGENHPYVCMVVFYDSEDNPMWRTTGSLIATDIVLTAGHGTYGTDHARVWFETDIRGTGYPIYGPTAYEGQVYTNPEYRSTPLPGLPGFDYHDVGIVVLNEAVSDITPAQLADVGLVDTLAMKSDVDLVGYGVQWQEHGKGVSPNDAWKWSGLRFYAPSKYVGSADALSSEFIKLTANPGQGKGGTAFGDSGGPILLKGTNVILAINSFVTNANCAGVTYAQRVDIQEIHDWINSKT